MMIDKQQIAQKPINNMWRQFSCTYVKMLWNKNAAIIRVYNYCKSLTQTQLHTYKNAAAKKWVINTSLTFICHQKKSIRTLCISL